MCIHTCMYIYIYIYIKDRCPALFFPNRLRVVWKPVRKEDSLRKYT